MLDPNYNIVNGEVIHYAPGVPQGAGYIPREQIDWLASAIAEAPGPCILCSHQSLEGTEKIRIEGTMGDYITPVSREELLRVDQRRLSDERLCSPSVRSYEVDLTRGSVTILKSI